MVLLVDVWHWDPAGEAWQQMPAVTPRFGPRDMLLTADVKFQLWSKRGRPAKYIWAQSLLRVTANVTFSLGQFSTLPGNVAPVGDFAFVF